MTHEKRLCGVQRMYSMDVKLWYPTIWYIKYLDMLDQMCIERHSDSQKRPLEGTWGPSTFPFVYVARTGGEIWH